MAGYAARKCLEKSRCDACGRQLLGTREDNGSEGADTLTTHFDRGGLLYPSRQLFRLVETLEGVFTKTFSEEKLHYESILDVTATLQERPIGFVGCPTRQCEVAQSIVKFYLLTRLHFFTKSVNKTRDGRRQKLRLTRLGRL